MKEPDTELDNDITASVLSLYQTRIIELANRAESLIAKIETSKTKTRANYYNKKLKKVNAQIAKLLQKSSRLTNHTTSNDEEDNDVKS